ncbi:ATP-dependent DNA helicase RecQ [Candidatus Saccharibacteria bacterium]|nr:ATP-dependent DNA helicase RecQ [Candidatus Saccharibacteria bacterium]
MVKQIRMVRAGARKEGYFSRFFERGGKFRLDYLRESREFLIENKKKLGCHFSGVEKVVFRGRSGGEKEKWLAILTFLYREGKIKGGDKIFVEEGMSGGIHEALAELGDIDGVFAKIFGEEKVVFGNKIEIIHEMNKTGEKNEIFESFEGRGREEFEGMSAEEWFYRKIMIPEVLEQGGNEADIIPQLEFSSILDEEVELIRIGGQLKENVSSDRRRMDFFLSGGNGGSMVIEIDDATHSGREAKDLERDRRARGNKIRVFRIKDKDLRDIERARGLFRKALKGFYLARGGSLETERDSNQLMTKKRSECDFEAFNGKILVGEEEKNEILVKAVSFPFEIMNLSIAIGKTTNNVSNKEGARGDESGERGEGKIFKNIEERRGEIEEGLKWLLKYIFGFDEFREGQLEAILRCLKGEDEIVLLPTGSGKSVIYQLLSFILPGATIVVEPLRALMEDQLINLEDRGIDLGVNLSAEMTVKQKKRVLDLIKMGCFGLIYVTPERLQMEEFREVLKCAKDNGVCFRLVAIDEAHCVSEWGHDFRVSYLNLSETVRKLLRAGGEKPRILALTGTASDNVLKDMERDIGISEDYVIRPESFDREEMHFRVIKVDSEEKLSCLEDLMGRIKDDFEGFSEEELRGIIFCVYKGGGSDFGVDAVYDRLSRLYVDEPIARYYGGEEKAFLRENMRKFKEDKAKVMVATKAFGMGIDKGNIRYTIHYGMTSSIEAYYQEAGRAGRDRRKAMSYILLSNDAPERNRELLTGVAIDEMRRELRRGGKNMRDDINRVLFLHQKNYDKRAFLSMAGRMIDKLGRISGEFEGEKHIVASNRIEFSEFQKVLFRLKILGVVRDYTVFDYANNEFLVLNKKFNPREIVYCYGEYVARYQKGQKHHEMNKIRNQKYRNQREFILAQLEILLDFTNEVFEKSRRRAILNMLELAEAGARIKDLNAADKEIRRRILNYLGASNKELLEGVLEDKKIIREAIVALFKVRRNGEEKLLPEAKRMLASYPEHPGLLLLVSGLELVCDETNDERGFEEFFEAMNNCEKYGVSEEEFYKSVLDLLKYTHRRAKNEQRYRDFVRIVERVFREKGFDSREKIMEILPEKFIRPFLAQVLIENTIISLSQIKYEERDLWTGRI